MYYFFTGKWYVVPLYYQHGREDTVDYLEFIETTTFSKVRIELMEDDEFQEL